MLVDIHIMPHERTEATKAYARFLTPNLIEQIEDAPSDRAIELYMGGGPTLVKLGARVCICEGNQVCDVCDPELVARAETDPSDFVNN